MEKKQKKARSKEEIAREKAIIKEQLEKMSVDDVLNKASEPTSREYARKFKQLYDGVRKSLVLIAKKRTHKLFTNQEAYEKAIEVLEAFVNEE